LKKFVLLGGFLLLTGLVSGQCVFLDGDVFVDSDVFYDCQGTVNISYSMDYPTNNSLFSHNAAIPFNASVYSSNQIVNTTLYVWNESGTLDRTYYNGTVGNGTKTFGSHTLASSTWTYGFLIWDNASSMSTVNNTFQVYDYNPYVTLGTPANTSTQESPLSFNCVVGNTTDLLQNTTLFVYNGSGLYTSSVDTVTGDGTKTFLSITLPDGVYNWTCQVCDIDGDCAYPPYENYTLTITTLIPAPGDEFGECVTERGYSYSFITSNDYILVNLTDLGNYVKNGNLENIWVEGPDAYRWTTSPYHLVLDTTVNKTVIVWIGDYNHNSSLTQLAPSIDETISLEFANFTRQNPAYWISLKNESSGDLTATSESTTFYLDVYCPQANYAPERWDLKNTIVNNTMLVITKTQPLFHGILDGGFNRKYESYLDTENISLYFLNTSTAITYDMVFSLEDYTGDFSDSYLIIYRKINRTLEKIWQQTWYNLEVENVTLENGTYFEYVVYTPEDTRIILWDLINGDSLDRTITIREPLFVDLLDYYQGISLGFTSSYSASTVGLAYTASSGTLSYVTFNVYNYSGSVYNLLSTQTVSGSQNGTITYIVPDNNQTYYVSVEADHSIYGVVSASDIIIPSITEERYPFYDSWGIPAEVMGITRDEIYTGASIFLISVVALTQEATLIGTGGLLVVAVIGITTFFGWFREMTWELFLFLAFAAVAFKLVEGRRRLE